MRARDTGRVVLKVRVVVAGDVEEAIGLRMEGRRVRANMVAVWL